MLFCLFFWCLQSWRCFDLKLYKSLWSCRSEQITTLKLTPNIMLAISMKDAKRNCKSNLGAPTVQSHILSTFHLETSWASLPNHWGLGILDCHHYPWACAKQNVRRTPVVMLYPTGNRPLGCVCAGNFWWQALLAISNQSFCRISTRHGHSHHLNFCENRSRRVMSLCF